MLFEDGSSSGEAFQQAPSVGGRDESSPKTDFRACGELKLGEEDLRPYIEVTLSKHPIKLLIDTGSTHSYLSSRGLELIGKPTLKKSNSFVSMANGKQEPIIGVLNTRLEFAKAKFMVKFRVVESLNYDGILGMDNIIALKLRVDFSKDYISLEPQAIESLNNDVINALIESSCASLKEITPNQRKQVEALVKAIIPENDTKLGLTPLTKHKIDVGDQPPIKQKQYPMSPKIQEIMNEKIDEMLRDGIIEESNSDWSNPVIMVKKSNGDFRFVVDARKLNQATKRDAYPLPRIQETLDRLRSARYITTIDLSQAYFQVALDDDSKRYTAFAVPGRGFYQFRRMLFGLTNSPATFQRLMDQIIGSDLFPFAFSYLDDIIIVSDNYEDHLIQLERVLKRIKAAGLTINRDKCHFCVNEVKYLGFVVNAEGLKIDEAKIEPIVNYPPPQRIKQLRRFIGMISWYRRFISDFATRVEDLLVLLRTGESWRWTDDQQRAFEDVKSELTHAPILSCPNFDEKFVLQTDASSYGLGAVLTQTIEGQERVIAFASKTLSKTERNYTVTEKECLADIWTVRKFRCYLEGYSFTVITDHSSLRWLHNLKNPTGRLARWALELMGYDYTIIHRKGALHHVPDALSRMYETTEILSAIEEVKVRDSWYATQLGKVKEFPERFPNWRIENEQLFFHRPEPVLEQIVEDLDAWKVVVPESKRSKVLQECHDQVTSGHLGIEKSYSRLACDYYWPGMFRDVVKYIKGCRICQATKADQSGPKGLMGLRNIETPWSVVSGDTIGPITRSKRGYAYIVVFQDLYTKWVECVPLRRANGTTIKEAFETRIAFHFGIPNVFISDSGPEYRNRVIAKMVADLGMRHMRTPGYWPRSNPTERSNRTIKQLINAFIEKDHQLWDVHIAELNFAINSAINSSTGFSPAFANFGRNLRGPRPFRDESRENLETQSFDATDWTDRMSRMRHVHDLVYKNIGESTLRQAAYYNRNRKNRSFQVGDKVWRVNKTLSSASENRTAKFCKKYLGPFVIQRKLSPIVYELVTENGKGAGKWHIAHLKLFTDATCDTETSQGLQFGRVRTPDGSGRRGSTTPTSGSPQVRAVPERSGRTRESQVVQPLYVGDGEFYSDPGTSDDLRSPLRYDTRSRKRKRNRGGEWSDLETAPKGAQDNPRSRKEARGGGHSSTEDESDRERSRTRNVPQTSLNHRETRAVEKPSGTGRRPGRPKKRKRGRPPKQAASEKPAEANLRTDGRGVSVRSNVPQGPCLRSHTRAAGGEGRGNSTGDVQSKSSIRPRQNSASDTAAKPTILAGPSDQRRGPGRPRKGTEKPRPAPLESRERPQTRAQTRIKLATKRA